MRIILKDETGEYRGRLTRTTAQYGDGKRKQGHPARSNKPLLQSRVDARVHSTRLAARAVGNHLGRAAESQIHSMARRDVGGEAITGVKGGLLRLGIFSAFVTIVVLVRVRFGLLIPDRFLSDIVWAAEVICLVGEIGIFATWPLRRRRAGRILWDLGQGDRRVSEFLLVGWLLLGGLGTIGLAMFGIDVGLLEGVLLLLAAAILLIEWKWGSKVTEHGLLRFHSLTPWRNLDVTWTSEEGFIAKRIPPRHPTLAHVALAGAALISVMALAALRAWLLPGA